MVTLDPHKARLLTQLISPHYPRQQILHLSDGGVDLHTTLYEFTRSKGFDYDLKTVGCDIEGIDAEAHGSCRIEPLDLRARQYNKQAKTYENIFVTLDSVTLGTDLANTLKKFYRIMKNAGILTLLVERGSPLTERLEQELEDCYFVAINRIDIFDDYEVITAKKLHGWGAYQVGF